MEMVYKSALVLHVASGFTALLVGLLVLIIKKGQKVHKLLGMIFFISMLGVSFSALFTSFLKFNVFLFHIGIFALYQNFSGFRATRNKSLKPAIIDWFMLSISAVNSVMMIYTFNIVLVVFGFISASLVFGELRIYIAHLRNREVPKLQWLTQHIGMMIGTYIATFTAFVVVNIKNMNPYWLPWILPTVFGVPLIVYFTRKYVPRNQKKSAQVAAVQTKINQG
jgi:uncharacterized membrane protein